MSVVQSSSNPSPSLRTQVMAIGKVIDTISSTMTRSLVGLTRVNSRRGLIKTLNELVGLDSWTLRCCSFKLIG